MPHQAKMPIAGASDRMACDDPVAEAMHVEGASAAEVMDSDQKYVIFDIAAKPDGNYGIEVVEHDGRVDTKILLKGN